MEGVFFDTYALIAVKNRKKSYDKFVDVVGVTTVFNLCEYAWLLRRELDKKIVFLEIIKVDPLLVDVDVEIVANAVEIRLKNKNMSMPDAIGYATSLFLKIPFVTGDDDFKGLPNVVFVKE